MEKDANIKIVNFLFKFIYLLHGPTSQLFYHFFFAGGVRAQFVELRESRQSKFADIPFR